ncbi:sigma-54 dependent transcriptional regulator [Marinobacterium arenosum]|uniref:sigma-54 dependent transcriptional regulator n=1 Tax=Marinobacterium arenosum TaxID=2862496 RepID=UPI001C97F0F8|nr:sigma-54 dependent transcriptional regulator [Marinobacterium arenosum]MBY4675934.1 sigma-54 dependent transcriptional regulator [Marinobacterium arenosum]
MGQEIVVIDDNQQRRTELGGLLEFIGCRSRVTDFVSWLQRDRNEPLAEGAVIAFGESSLPVSLEKMLLELQELQPGTAVLFLAEWAEVETLPAPLQQMICAQIHYPYRYKELMDALYQAQHYAQACRAQRQATCDDFSMQDGLVGISPQMQRVRQMIAQVAGRDVSVLITGESGTGKELVAQTLHNRSTRANGPFVPINCGAIPPDLLESELFGHEKGAFTGAVSSRQGRFELAQGGTLFLDEVGDMPLPMQVKLLRVLQEREFERVGGIKTISVDVRVIAATHKNLEQMILDGGFREDLYYRLNVFPIEMPALRERQNDLPVLLDELVQRIDDAGMGRLRFHPSALESLMQHDWPGNVRELANLVERLAIMYPDGVIGIDELPAKFRYGAGSATLPDIAATGQQSLPLLVPQSINAGQAVPMDQLPEEGVDLKAHLEQIEQSLIRQALEASDHVVARAADKLQIRRTTLVEKMRKYGIQRK